jgi:N-carbamoyl-L-amino-acid hydrolase
VQRPQTVQESIFDHRTLAEQLFTQLEQGSRTQRGVTRDSFGAGENFAHSLFAKYAASLGLEVSVDFVGNTYATWPGVDRSLPRIIIGSHLDSVSEGGNFDGAAGVVAGLVSVAALRSLEMKPRHDIQVMAIRAEESAWFQFSYIGSRSALGTLPEGALEAKRVDTGRTLSDHLTTSGGDPGAIRRRERYIDPSTVKAFLEVHIEQAPSLVEANVPIAICTAIPGNFRYGRVSINGEHAHVGLPRRFRRDCAMAAAEFALGLEKIWEEYETLGMPMACTLGRFHTDTAYHSLTNVPGLFHLSIDIRAYDQGQLEDVERRTLKLIRAIEAKRSVTFDMGARASAAIGFADPAIQRALFSSAETLQIPCIRLGSPGSHDAAAFAESGIPIGMVFVRNRNGSHNPDEAMDIPDFLDACSVLSLWLATNACVPVEAVAAEG